MHGKKRVVLGLAIIVVSVLAGGLLVINSCMEGPGELGTGDPEYAEKWHGRIQLLSDPDAARAQFPEVEILRFDNGEWVFGVSDDSHSSAHGGTVVTKDSAGNTHAFFGHVCGPRFFERLRDAKSLKEFYVHQAWQLWDFREHKLNKGA